MVPAAPVAPLVVIQSELLLELLIVLLDLPACFGDLHQSSKAVIGRQIAEEIPGRFRSFFRPLGQQPDLFARFATLVKSVGRLHAGRPEARLQAAFTAFPPAYFLPVSGLLCSFFYGDGPLLTVVRCAGRPPGLLRLQLARPGWLDPNSGVGLHAHGITELALLQLFTKRRRIAIAGIRYDYPVCQLPPARLIDHLHSQFPFLSKLDFLRDAGLRAPLRIVRPTLRQVQTPTQNSGALRADFVQTDSDLAIGCLAERSRVLTFHAHGVLSLLRKAGVINSPNRIRLQFLNHSPR